MRHQLMDRRDFFRTLLGGFGAALIAALVPQLPRRQPKFLGAGAPIFNGITWDTAPTVMGEQAYWPQEETDVQARLAAIKIDDQWVDVSGWSDEQVRAHILANPPGPLKRPA